MMYVKIVIAISVLSGLVSCGWMRYGAVTKQDTALRKSNISDPQIEYISVPEKTAETDRIQKLEGYIFHLYLNPERPGVGDLVEVELAVQDAKTLLPAVGLTVDCRTVNESNFFITQCNRAYEKNSMQHHSLTISFTSPGTWQLRFEINTHDNKKIMPMFSVAVN